MELNSHYRDLFASLNDAGVRYLLVGGYAMAYHRLPRFTKDIDIWVEPTLDNSERVWKALRAFGSPQKDINRTTFSKPDVIFQIGVPPNRIDIISSIEALDFQSAWKNRVDTRFCAIPIYVLGHADLVANKRAVGRPQDLLDADALERAKARSKRRRKK